MGRSRARHPSRTGEVGSTSSTVAIRAGDLRHRPAGALLLEQDCADEGADGTDEDEPVPDAEVVATLAQEEKRDRIQRREEPEHEVDLVPGEPRNPIGHADVREP